MLSSEIYKTLEDIKKLRDEGWTYQAIADKYGTSRQNIQQRVTRERKQFWKVEQPDYYRHKYHKKINKYFNNCWMCNEYKIPNE